MTATITIDGDDMSFEREVSDITAVRIMELAVNDGRTDESGRETSASDRDVADESVADDEQRWENDQRLPNSFFDRLTDKQEAFVRVLLDDGDWVSNAELRRRMEEDYDEVTGGSQGVAGIRAGFTRKYGDDFDIVERRWTGIQNEYKLNEVYVEELRDAFEQ